MINPAVLLDRYAAEFGATHIRIVSYNTLVDTGTELLGHFLKTFLNFTDIPAIDRSRRNVSSGPVDTEILRSLNLIGQASGDGRPPLDAGHYIGRRSELDLALVRSAMERSLAPVKFNETAPVYAEIAAKVLGAYEHAFVEPRPRGTLYPATAKTLEYVGEGYRLEAGVVDALDAAYAKIRGGGAARGRPDQLE